jgi:hypothetical protein
VALVGAEFQRNVGAMMEVIRSSETSTLTIATWYHIPEYGILLWDHLRLDTQAFEDNIKEVSGKCTASGRS